MRRSVSRVVGAAVLVVPGALVLTSAPSSAVPTSVSFACTGAPSDFVVPAGVTTLQVELRGAQGGAGSADGGNGGLTSATIAVTPGETLQVNVGCAGGDLSDTVGGVGGYNGGADGGDGLFGGGGDAAPARCGCVSGDQGFDFGARQLLHEIGQPALQMRPVSMHDQHRFPIEHGLPHRPALARFVDDAMWHAKHRQFDAGPEIRPVGQRRQPRFQPSAMPVQETVDVALRVTRRHGDTQALPARADPQRQPLGPRAFHDPQRQFTTRHAMHALAGGRGGWFRSGLSGQEIRQHGHEPYLIPGLGESAFRARKRPGPVKRVRPLASGAGRCVTRRTRGSPERYRSASLRRPWKPRDHA